MPFWPVSRSPRPRAATVLRSLLVLVFAALIGVPALSSGQVQIKGKVKILIDPGYDLFETAPGTSFDFSNTPLPAGFFGPGSQPYGGVIPLQGTPLGYFHGKATGETDTIVQRLDPIELHTPTSQAQVPIEIVALSLQSAQPITVHNGTGTEKWDVSVGLSPTASPKGSMTIHGHDKQGGTFDSTLPVLPKLTFSRLGDRKQVTLDVGKLPASSPLRSGLDLRAHHVHYTYDAAGRLLTIHGLNQGFCAGCTRTSGRRFSEKSRLAKHKVHVPDRLARIPKGFDIFQTQPTKTNFTVPNSFPIPAGFFAAGSKPFSGEIKFEGVPIGTFHGKDVGDADTVVQRKRNAHVGPGDGKATIPIELVQLHLQSTEPIKVKVGSSTELWDVSATVSHKRHSAGHMTIRKKNESGGTFSSSFPVYPLLTFTRVSTGTTKTLDMGALQLPKNVASGIVFGASNVPWQKGCRGPALHVPGLNDDFCPSLNAHAQKVLTEEQAKLAAHGVMPAQPMKLPPIVCPLTPSPLKFPPGSSANAACVLKRMESPHSFFDVFFQLEPVSPFQGINVQLSAPKTTLRRGESGTLHVHVAGASDAPLGSYNVPIRLVERAGADRAVKTFTLPVTIQTQCSDGIDNDGDGKIDLADPGCANARDNNETDPAFNGNGQGMFTGASGSRVDFTIGFNQPTTGFKIVVPPASGPTPRTISKDGADPTGFTCTVETTNTTDDSFSCKGNLAGSTPVNGQFDTNPSPASGMGAALFGYQSGPDGTATGGPFPIFGPS